MANYSQQMYDQAGIRPVIMDSSDVRKGFLAKVYATFGIGLVLATAACIATFATPSLMKLALTVWGSTWTYIIAVVALTFGVNLASRVPVLNVVAFAIYTFFFGMLTAPLVGYAVAATGSTLVVGQALGMTVVVFGGLSVWALTTREDLSGWRSALMIGALILFGIGLVGMFTAFNVGLWYSALWVVLLAGFTMYDTQMIQRRYPATMWMAGAITLFVDFLMMFWHLLSLLTGGKRN